jgi:hypothetical protein
MVQRPCSDQIVTLQSTFKSTKCLCATLSFSDNSVKQLYNEGSEFHGERCGQPNEEYDMTFQVSLGHQPFRP